MLVFNDTTTYRGLVQLYEKEIGAQRGFISGNTNRLKEFTADANLALDDFIALAIRSSGTWQFDDSNQTEYPIILANLVSGQRDYTFTTDEQGNLILDIFRVFVADASGVFTEIYPVDVSGGVDAPSGASSGSLGSGGLASFTDGRNTTGTPRRYDKLANGIFLDPIPGYNRTLGLKVYINREGSYFVSGDTTKKAGIPGLFHKYLYLKPASEYARRNTLVNAERIHREVMLMEGDEAQNIIGTIQTYFSERPRDEVRRLTVMGEDNK